MFSTLPDFTPRDHHEQSHSLWYSSSRNPLSSSGAVDGSHHHHNADVASNQHGANQQRQRSQQILEKTALARLAADEHYMHLRRVNVQNFGSMWLRPPGVPKTLHQMREEKREQEEHQEAMRREQLAQELAEAEAEGVMAGEGTMDDIQLDGAQDLDDEIPDAGFEYDYSFDEEEENREEVDEEEEEEEEEDNEGVQPHDDDDDDDDDDDNDNDNDNDNAGGDSGRGGTEEQREERRDLMAARMRISDDAFREALVRGDPEGTSIYGGEEDLDDDANQENMLDEEDFAAEGTLTLDDGDMGANLDDDIPEADDGGGYEHTDSEAEFTQGSDGDEENENRGGGAGAQQQQQQQDEIPDVSFAPRAAPLGPPQSPTLRGRLSLPRYRASMDLSGLLSQDESSFMESSPAQGRRARRR